MKLIGLNGVAQSGKDSAAKFLIELGWKRIAFADAVREAALAINPIVFDYDDDGYPEATCLSSLVDNLGWDIAKQNPEVRRLLQVIGTEAGRNIHGPDCWVLAAENKLEPNRNHVFTDVRFPNECEWIQSAGGKVYKVERPGVGPVNSHISDNLELPVDGIIVNDGSLDDLKTKILELVK